MPEDDTGTKFDVQNRIENTYINTNTLGSWIFVIIVVIQCLMFMINCSTLLTTKIPEYQLFFPTLAIMAVCVAGAMGKSLV